MKRLFLQTLALITLSLGVYVHLPQADFIPIDDSSLTYKNPLVTELSTETVRGVFSTYDPELYVPLTMMSFQLDYLRGGGDPGAFHTTNLALHAINVVLVFMLISLLTKRTWLAMLVAAVFAVHPIHTETVAWVSARKDLLSATFFLGSLITYIQYQQSKQRLPYYASITLFTLALLSKVVTATLPLVLIVIDDALGAKPSKKERLRKVPYALLAALFLYIGMHGKSLTVYFIGYFETFLLAGKSAAFYVQQLLLPVRFLPLYQQDLPISALSLEFVLPFAVLGLLYLIAIASRPIHKLISVGILWYGVTLLPSLANFSRGEGWAVFYASDRYAYLPSIGFLLTLGIGGWLLWQQASLQQKKLLAALSVVLVASLSVKSYYQSKLWVTPQALFTYATEQAPRTHLAHALLGIMEMENDNYPAAISHLRVSSELSPVYPDGRSHYGLALIKNNQVDEGMKELEATISLNADYVPAYIYLAYGSVIKGDLEQAKRTIDRALQIQPNNAKAYQLLGSIAEQEGDRQKAREYYEHSLKLNPRSVRTMSALRQVM